MSLNQSKNFESESKEFKKDLEKRQTKWFYDDSNINDVIDDKAKESRVKSSSFRHMTHISWKDDGSLEISTNDREMADFFRKVGDTLCLQESKDIQEVIFDYVTNSMSSEEDDVEKNLGIDQTHHESDDKTVRDNIQNEVVNENDIVKERFDDKDLETVKICNIGKPYNFQHVTHCSFDRKSGFNIVTNDRKLSWFYNRKEKKKGSKN